MRPLELRLLAAINVIEPGNWLDRKATKGFVHPPIEAVSGI